MKKRFYIFIVLTIFFTILTTICQLNIYAYSKSDLQQKLLNAVYGGAGGYISCDFDGYTSTSGRHEGIDLALYKGANVYSVMDGTVVSARTASNGLTTIAIYNSTYNLTVIYLHSQNFAVSTGGSVSRGQLISHEGTGGTSSSHTHVEIRVGYQNSASISVGDSKLDNPDPYPYWEKILIDDTAPPVISNARVIASDNNGYMLECNVTDNTAVSYVQCATWTLENGQDDIQWTNMVNTGENTWKLYISYADHGNQKNVAYGNDIYAYDTSGNGIYVSVVFNDWSPPLITDYKIVGVDSNGYMLQCNVADDSQVSSVRCATWTSANGHDDIQWTDMVKTGENIWKLYISFADHGNEMDQYCNDIYAYDSLNQGTYVSVGYNRNLNIGDDFYAIVKNIGYKTVLTNLTGNDNYYITGESSVQNAEQLWSFQINSNNEYTIKSVIDGQAMEIYGGASADGSRPNVLTFNNTDAQKWYISNNISGYNIVPKCAVGKTLQTHANGTIDIYSIESNKDSQAFEISILKNSEISSFYPQINEVKFYNTNSYTNTSTQFSEGDTIYMRNSFKNIPGFDMSIYKDNQLISSQHINKLNEEVSISNVKSGNYKVVLKGENQLNSIEKTAAFSVVNKSVTPTAKPTDIPSGKVTTKTKITAYEKKYILNTQVSNLHEKGAHIIFAAYDKNNTMIDIIDKIYDGNNLVTEFKDNSNISYVKIFVWRNYNTITPLTENIEYITFR